MDFFGSSIRQRNAARMTHLRQLAFAPPVQAEAISGPPQPHDPQHPGSDSYPHLTYSVNSYYVWHFNFGAIYPTIVTYLLPSILPSEKVFPVIAVSPGKFLDQPTAYDKLLAHMCRKGYIVLFVDTDTGPLDCQHSRMAKEFLEAVSKVIKSKLKTYTNTPVKLAWWGHSMGAKVQALAGQMTTDSNYIKPTAVIGNNFSNDKGGFCNDDALPGATTIPASVRYSVIQGDRDDISKGDPRLLYNALTQMPNRQLITVVSYPDDSLIADHFAPLTDSTIIASGKVDALDYWLYWKIAVGAWDYHFKNGPDKWAYGSERTDGGIDSAGNKLLHKVEQP